MPCTFWFFDVFKEYLITICDNIITARLAYGTYSTQYTLNCIQVPTEVLILNNTFSLRFSSYIEQRRTIDGILVDNITYIFQIFFTYGMRRVNNGQNLIIISFNNISKFNMTETIVCFG
jgi:hypothetical protein